MRVDSPTALTVPTVNYLSFLSPNKKINLFISIQRVFVKDFSASIHLSKCATRVDNLRVLDFLKISNEVLFRKKIEKRVKHNVSMLP